MESLRRVAENRASAAFLAQFRTTLMFDPGDSLRAELSKRGPLFRQEKKTVGPGSYLRPFDDEVGPSIVRGVRAVRITLCPGLDQGNASVLHLLEVAHIDGVEIAAEKPRDTDNVHSLTVHVSQEPHAGGGMQMRLGTRR